MQSSEFRHPCAHRLLSDHSYRTGRYQRRFLAALDTRMIDVGLVTDEQRPSIWTLRVDAVAKAPKAPGQDGFRRIAFGKP